MIPKKINYEDYSSARVLYGASGATNFPVRLSVEIFEWCDKYLASKKVKTPYTIYDPFCGVAYAITVLGFLYSSKIKTIIASDADQTMTEFAQKNLSLLTAQGITHRIEELKTFIAEYNKSSHREALESAYRLKNKIPKNINTHVFKLSILDKNQLPEEIKNINLVFTDISQEQIAHSKDLQENSNNIIQVFLDTIKKTLDKHALVAIAVDKKQAFSHEGYTKIKVFNRATRRVIVLEPKN